MNKHTLKFKAVSKGDVIMCSNRKYEILWPPKKLTQEQALTDIRNAIKDFEKAKQSDSRLNGIYQRVYKNYSDRNINQVNTEQQPNNFSLTEFVGELSETVQRANDSLRKAANRLSVAFQQEDNLLFLGDLESREIKLVVNELVRNKNTVYDVLIAAHHGTHWHKSLTGIHCNTCLASIGKTLQKNIRYEYKDIADKLKRTDELGNIHITKTIE